MPYKRLQGFSRVKRNDVIVFNFPEGDSMVVQYPGQNYYSLVRQYGRDYILSEFGVITHPVDKRENYVKRCIGLPGDTVHIDNGEIRVNGEAKAALPLQKSEKDQWLFSEVDCISTTRDFRGGFNDWSTNVSGTDLHIRFSGCRGCWPGLSLYR